MTNKLVLIAAVSRNGVIGDGKSLPWRIPKDLKHFKRITQDHVVIMGRKTLESMNNTLLPGRINYVVSRKYDEAIPSPMIEMVRSHEVLRYDSNDLDTAIMHARMTHSEKTIFIIGGSEIYYQTIDRADELIISHVEEDATGLTFPPIRRREFKEVSHVSEPFANIPFSLVTYRRLY